MTTTSTPARWPLFNALAQWLRPSPTSRDLAFLESCRGEEIERLRAHVRGRPEDLRWLVGREPDSTEMLSHMMDVTGVDERKVPAKAMRELERNCAGCKSKFHCADEIGNGRAARTFDRFCPNAQTRQTLQSRAAG